MSWFSLFNSSFPSRFRRAPGLARYIFSASHGGSFFSQGKTTAKPCHSEPTAAYSQFIIRRANFSLQQCCFFSSIGSLNLVPYSSDDENPRIMEVVIISKEHIKPYSPTPHYLRNFKLSILDQIFPSFYIPLLLFYLNDERYPTDQVIVKRSKRLKQSLSETLTHFYPFAGRIKDDLQIDCNDEGIHYVEARVNYRLQDFLHQPHDQLMRKLAPQDPNFMELTSGKYVITIQVNIFECGGIAISTCTSHKIIDGHSYATFMKAWASNAHGGSSEVVSPSFIAPSLFPQNPSMLSKWPSMVSEKRTSTKRFLFDASALASLKTKAVVAERPTRVEVVSALLWKCAIKAASEARSFGSEMPSILTFLVNLRRKMSPKLPKYSTGNLLWLAIAQYTHNAELELPSMVDHVKKAIAKISSDSIEEIKGDEGCFKIEESVQDYGKLINSIDKEDCIMHASLCHTSLYEIDFGWGKPIWFYYCNPGAASFMVLVDTRSGDGIEATVTLLEQDMAVFARDTELLALTTLDPCPL